MAEQIDMSSEEIVISVKNLSKRYRIGLAEEKHETFAQQMWHMITAPLRNFKNLKSLSKFAKDTEDESIFWALKDINFEVKKGEVLGIIGHNGAGKSTLLKILSRITEPTDGEIRITGRVSSLLEVGTGFHPDLTGRENVYMNGTILGMTKKEIDRKFSEIHDFSGIGKYIDTPVKRYSSGMKVRLAFSVAAHLEPEILIIDEVLAVGDLEFQQKCLGKMEDISGQGRTVLFVSHNMAAIEALCSRTLMLQNGELYEQGNTLEVIKKFIERLSSSSNNFINNHFENDYFKLLDFNIQGLTSEGVVRNGENVKIVLKFENIKTENILPAIHVVKNDNILFTLNTRLTGQDHFKNPGSFFSIECLVPNFPLSSGKYNINLFFNINYTVDFKLDHFMSFLVEDGQFFKTAKKPKTNGMFLVQQSWNLVSN